MLKNKFLLLLLITTSAASFGKTVKAEAQKKLSSKQYAAMQIVNAAIGAATGATCAYYESYLANQDGQSKLPKGSYSIFSWIVFSVLRDQLVGSLYYVSQGKDANAKEKAINTGIKEQATDTTKREPVVVRYAFNINGVPESADAKYTFSTSVARLADWITYLYLKMNS